MLRVWLGYAYPCRPFGDLSRDWLCYVDTLVILPVFVYAM